MHWSGEHDRLTEEQVASHKRQLARLSDQELQRSYRCTFAPSNSTKATRPSTRRCNISSNAGGNCAGDDAPDSADLQNFRQPFPYV